MTTVRLYVTEGGVFKNSSDSGDFTSAKVTAAPGSSLRLIGKLAALGSQYKYRDIISFEAGAFIEASTTESSASGRLYVHTLTAPYSRESASYGTETLSLFNSTSTNPKITLTPSSPASQYFTGSDDFLAGVKRAIDNGVRFWVSEDTGKSFTKAITTAHGTKKPYIELNLSDEDAYLTPANLSPASGYVDEKKSKYFSWGVTKSSARTYSDVSMGASAVFQWREGTSGTVQSIQASSLTGVTVPANTFPTTGNFQWRVKLTAGSGVVKYSDWKTINTTEPLSTSIADSPKNEVISDANEIQFSWNYSSPVGSPQSGADLQYNNNGVWTDFANVTGEGRTTNVQASIFSGGEVTWRVRTYNGDNEPGSWSDTATFILIAAPPAPAISVDQKPFTEISWQSANQQAYKITLDGELIKKAYGTDKAYYFSLPLEDGQHTVGVSVQGAYGLWSQEALASFNVENDPGEGELVLMSQSGIDAELSWETEGTADFFLIFRDGKAIGKTSGTSFADRLAAGVHGYSVVMKLTDGNYVRSNTANAWSGSKTPSICEFPGGQWVELKLSERSNSEQNYSYTRIATSRHVMGAEYPVIEMSEFSDMSASYDAAFVDVEDAREFERLKGKIVLIKSRAEEPIVAAMTALEKKTGDFYLSYTFTVQRIHWEDFTDETNS